MMEELQSHRHIERKLTLRVQLYILLTAVIFAILIYDIVRDNVAFYLVIPGILVGIVLGILISRIFKISWNKRAKKVIYKLDIFGVLILATYLAFEFHREKVIAYFVSGPAVVATSMAVLFGIMLGRIMGIRRKISSVLEENL